MKYKMNYIITGTMALLIGLSAGYFIFHEEQVLTEKHETHTHTNEQMESHGKGIWTCSMHPQVRREEPGDCPICGMDLIPAENSDTGGPLRIEMTDDAIKLANIQTTVIGSTIAQAERTTTLSGKVQVDERLAASQVAHIPGRIEQLFVTYTGEEVRKGQPLATIYSPELITAQREVIEAVKLKELNPALLQAARNKLKYWKIDSREIDRMAESGELKETFTIHADASGVVTGRRVSVGDYVRKGEPFLDLMGLNRVWVLFDVYEQDLANISVGDQIEFTTPSMPDKVFKTKVTFIDPVINPTTRTASVRAEISNTRRNLKPEMFVKGQIQKKWNDNAELNLVPKSAVLWTGRRSVVYVKVPDTHIPSYEFREITLGNAVGNQYQVIDGISNGEEIVTNGSFAIDAAAQLNNQASMINRLVSTSNTEDAQILPDYDTSTPLLFKEQLSAVIQSYISLKNALVDSDQIKSVAAGESLLNDLQNVDMSLLEDEPHLYWMKQAANIKERATNIVQNENLSEQRNEFHLLSKAIINSIKAFGNAADIYFIQHCPMANSDQGADWLSENPEILNPYFGAQMLSCGFPTDTIAKSIY